MAMSLPEKMALSGDSNSKKAKGEAALKLIGKPAVSSGLSIGGKGKAVASSGSRGKAVVSENVDEVMSFRNVRFGPQESEVRFRLIHYWEARKVLSKVLLGLEMLLIDSEGTVIQGFIPEGRIQAYLPRLKTRAIYKLINFFGSKNKGLYRVAEPDVTITFSWNSVLSALEDSSVPFPEDRFRFHGYEEFEAACGLKGDLYDYVGHIKLINGQVLNDSVLLDEAEIASTRHVLLPVQTHDGPVMKLYLWDKAAFDFSAKFKASGSTASVILVTALNPKRFGGALSLCTMTPSRVFMDSDVEETRYYLSWFNSNLDVANRVNAEVVTKAETVTLEELVSYTKQGDAKVAWFECTATIDDVVHGSGWYYIGCGVFHTKAIKGPTTLMCTKCGESEIVGVAQYLSKISVYDKNDQAVFVLLGDAGQELTGKKASELVESYYEANESVGADHIVPVPQALIDTVGQTRKFIVKVSKHNFTGKIQTFTLTKVLPLEDQEADGNIEENVQLGPVNDKEDPTDESLKRSSEGIATGETKRAKSG